MYIVKQRMQTRTGRVLEKGDVLVKGRHADVDKKLEELLNGSKSGE